MHTYWCKQPSKQIYIYAFGMIYLHILWRHTGHQTGTFSPMANGSISSAYSSNTNMAIALEPLQFLWELHMTYQTSGLSLDQRSAKSKEKWQTNCQTQACMLAPKTTISDIFYLLYLYICNLTKVNIFSRYLHNYITPWLSPKCMQISCEMYKIY